MPVSDLLFPNQYRQKVLALMLMNPANAAAAHLDGGLGPNWTGFHAICLIAWSLCKLRLAALKNALRAKGR